MVDVRTRSEADEDGHVEDATAPPLRSADTAFAIALVAALVPIVVATVRAARQGWEPVGDNAYFLIRARDVGTEHHPLLGTWTSASLNTDTNFNNPGPLLFDILAIPAKLGGGIGLAVGVAVLNAVAVVGTALMARRQAGPVVGLVALAATSLLCASMGSQLLFDPWQPHSLLLPFLFTVTAVWAVSNGDVWAAPWAIGVASMIVQTHMSYAVLVAAIGLWAVVGLALCLRRQWASIDDDERAGAKRRLVRAAAACAVVLVVCWGQTVVEQLTAEGPGNLSRLASNATSSEQTVGVGLGTRIVADTLTVPPFWLRPSFEDNLKVTGVPGEEQQTLASVDPSTPVALVLLLGLGGVLVACAWTAGRRRDRTVTTLAVTAAVALAAGLITAWQLPFGVFGIAAHQFRWMWPLGAFLLIAVAASVLRATPRPRRPDRWVAIVAAGVVVVVSALNLPTYNVQSGPTRDERAFEVMRRARPQMEALEGLGPILVDFEGIRFAEPYSGPIMAELQRRDIPFVVADEVLVRQLGESRRQEGPARRLVFRDGDQSANAIPGAERVVHVVGLDGGQRRELDELREEIADHITREGLRTPDPLATLVPPSLRGVVGRLPAPDAVEALFTYRVIVSLLDRGLLTVDDDWRDRFARYAELQKASDAGSLSLFLFPVGQ